MVESVDSLTILQFFFQADSHGLKHRTQEYLKLIKKWFEYKIPLVVNINQTHYLSFICVIYGLLNFRFNIGRSKSANEIKHLGIAMNHMEHYIVI